MNTDTSLTSQARLESTTVELSFVLSEFKKHILDKGKLKYADY